MSSSHNTDEVGRLRKTYKMAGFFLSLILLVGAVGVVLASQTGKSHQPSTFAISVTPTPGVTYVQGSPTPSGPYPTYTTPSPTFGPTITPTTYPSVIPSTYPSVSPSPTYVQTSPTPSYNSGAYPSVTLLPMPTEFPTYVYTGPTIVAAKQPSKVVSEAYDLTTITPPVTGTQVKTIEIKEGNKLIAKGAEGVTLDTTLMSEGIHSLSVSVTDLSNVQTSYQIKIKVKNMRGFWRSSWYKVTTPWRAMISL